MIGTGLSKLPIALSTMADIENGKASSLEVKSSSIPKKVSFQTISVTSELKQY